MAEQTKIDNQSFNPLHMVVAALLFQKKKKESVLFSLCWRKQKNNARKKKVHLVEIYNISGSDGTILITVFSSIKSSVSPHLFAIIIQKFEMCIIE